MRWQFLTAQGKQLGKGKKQDAVEQSRTELLVADYAIFQSWWGQGLSKEYLN